MPIIELPDGREVEFPDGMDNAAISSAIQKNFPEFAPKKSLVDRFTGVLSTIDSALRNAPDPLRDKLAADKRDGQSVMERTPVPPRAAADAAGPDYGIRADGTKKGRGFLGELKTSDGQVMTEFSVGVNIGGKDVEIPTIVPTLTKQELAHLQNGGDPTPAIVQKAAQFAQQRMAKGLSPFASAEESPAPAAAPAPRGLFADLKSTDVLPSATASAQATRDMIDRSAEARTRRLTGQGMNVDQAKYVGKRAADAGILPGQEGGASRMEATDVDFATRHKFNEDPFFKNPAVRAAVKGYQGYQQGTRGLAQFGAEVLGADDLALSLASDSAKSRRFTDAMGEPTDHLTRNFEGAVSSIATQLPSLIGGAITGSEAITLGSMFAQTFGSEYSDGRAQGQNVGNATKRAGLMASFEVIGEKFGLGERLHIISNAARGVETNALAKFLGNTLKNELPGEMLTTTGQFGTDKLTDVGLKQDAGWSDYLQQMGDTVTQTVMQGGIMGAATGGVNAGMHGLRAGDNAKTATADADFARSQALAKWNTNGLTARPAPAADPVAAAMPPSSAAPVRREPTLGAITGAASVDDAIRAADDLVHADPIRSPHATAADIDALENAAFAQITEGGTPDANDLTLPQDGAIGAGGRDRLAAGTGSDNAGPVETAGLVSGQEPGTAGIAGADSGLDRVRAGAGTDAQPALTPQRDAIDAVVDHANDWHAFPPETGTLGVPRVQMPQIPAHARGAMVNFLKARGIAHEQVEVPAESLKPTQAEFSLAKVHKAMGYEGDGRSILVSSDGHVLDGHHQWMAALDAGQPVKAIRLDAPIAQLLEQVKEFPSTGTAAGAPTQEVAAHVSERPQVPEEAEIAPGAQGAAPASASAGKPASKLDAARAKHQRQDDAVAQAAANIAARQEERARIESMRKKESPNNTNEDRAPTLQLEREDATSAMHKIMDDSGQQIGQIWTRKRTTSEGDKSVPVLQVHNAGLNNDTTKGKGYGVRAYIELVDQALADGKQVWSDPSVSSDAQRVYAALKRRGYDVQENRAKPPVRTDDGTLVSNGSYVYKITSKKTPSDNLTSEASDVLPDPESAGSRATGEQAEKTADAPATESAQGTARAHEDARVAVAPARDDGADIPAVFFKKVKVAHDVWNAADGRYDTTQLPADQALAAARADIDNLEALLKCMRG